MPKWYSWLRRVLTIVVWAYRGAGVESKSHDFNAIELRFLGRLVMNKLLEFHNLSSRVRLVGFRIDRRVALYVVAAGIRNVSVLSQ
jgi:hypothetical protein